MAVATVGRTASYTTLPDMTRCAHSYERPCFAV
jgi:hypothetical protein